MSVVTRAGIGGAATGAAATSVLFLALRDASLIVANLTTVAICIVAAIVAAIAATPRWESRR